MTELVHELGPFDWLVVELPGSRFKREIAPIISDLVDIIRVLAPFFSARWFARACPVFK
jgi:hypothetical protein